MSKETTEAIGGETEQQCTSDFSNTPSVINFFDEDDILNLVRKSIHPKRFRPAWRRNRAPRPPTSPESALWLKIRRRKYERRRMKELIKEGHVKPPHLSKQEWMEHHDGLPFTVWEDIDGRQLYFQFKVQSIVSRHSPEIAQWIERAVGSEYRREGHQEWSRQMHFRKRWAARAMRRTWRKRGKFERYL